MVMTHMEIKALDNTGSHTMVWTQGYDGQTHYADVFKPLRPQC